MNHRPNISDKLIVSLTLISLTLSILSGCSRSDKSASDNSALQTDVMEITGRLFSDPDQALSVGRNFLVDVPDSTYLYGIKSAMSLAFLLTGDKDSCRIYRSEVDEYLTRNPENYILSELHNYHLSLYYNIVADLDSCIYYAEIASRNAISGGLIHRAVIDLSIAGESQEMLGRPVEATSTYRRAIAISDSLGNEGTTCVRILIGLANTYSSIGNYEMADSYFDEIENETEDFPSVGPRFLLYSSKGTSLYNRHDYRDAIDVFHKAYVLADSIKNINFIGVTETNLAECHMLLGNLDSAEYYLDKAAVNLTAHGELDANQKFYFNSLRGDLELRKGNIKEAFDRLNMASRDTLAILPRYAAYHYNRLARYYNHIADYRQAMEYKDRARQIDDSIKNRSAYNYTAELEYRYAQDTTVLKGRMRLDEKVEEVNHLRSLITVIFLLVVLIIIALSLRNKLIRRKQALEAARLSISVQRLRMENISNRISTHFIFNILNGVDISAKDKIKDVSELIRQNLKLCNQPLVTLRDELNFIDQYVKVERSTIGDDFTYHQELDPDIDLSRKIPAMMLEIFVENSVKHGLRGFEGQKYLNISLRHSDNSLVITVVNNGHMISTAPGTGTGLRVISQTVHLLNLHNRYKIQIQQDINRDINEYCVRIIIPDHYNFAALFN